MLTEPPVEKQRRLFLVGSNTTSSKSWWGLVDSFDSRQQNGGNSWGCIQLSNYFRDGMVLSGSTKKKNIRITSGISSICVVTAALWWSVLYCTSTRPTVFVAAAMHPKNHDGRHVGSSSSSSFRTRNARSLGRRHQRQQHQQLPATTTPIAEDTTAKKVASDEGIYVDKPLLRGKFHQYGAILYPPFLGVPLYVRARTIATATTTITTIATTNIARMTLVFSAAVESIMLVSGMLHTYPWQTPYWYQFTRKLDFVTIFFGIAAFYSSMGKLLLGTHPWFPSIERLGWGIALLGSSLKWWIPNCAPATNAFLFLVQGWIVLPLVPTLFRTCSSHEALGMFLGGVFVTGGAVAYSLQWPLPDHYKHQQQQHGIPPTLTSTALLQRDLIFGPHEMFHAGTVLMFLSFWYTMWMKVSSFT